VSLPKAAKHGRASISFPRKPAGLRFEVGIAGASASVEISTVAGRSRRVNARSLSASSAWRPSRCARRDADVLSTRSLYDADYQLLACPTLHSGQTVECRFGSRRRNANRPALRKCLRRKGLKLKQIRGEAREVAFGKETLLSWRVPDTGAYPIFELDWRSKRRTRSE